MTPPLIAGIIGLIMCAVFCCLAWSERSNSVHSSFWDLAIVTLLMSLPWLLWGMAEQQRSDVIKIDISIRK